MLILIINRMLRYWLLLVCLIGIGVLAEKVWATEAVELDTKVITATRSEKSLAAAPGSVEVLSRAAIRELGAQTVEDVLETAVGSILTNNPGRVRQASIRGSGTGRTLILIDGRRIARGYRDNIDLGRILVGQIERIEIVRGPSSALYGADAMGGVVNIITTKPQQSEGHAQLRYNAGNASGWRASAGGGVATERFGIIGHAGFLNRNEYNADPDDGLSDVDDQQLVNGTAQAEYRLNDRHMLRLGGGYAAFDRDGDRFMQGQTRLREADDRRSDVFGHYQGRLSQSLQLTADAYYSVFDSDINLSPMPSFRDVGETQDLTQAQAQADWAFGNGQSLMIGADVRREGIDEPDADIEDSIINSGGFTQLDLLVPYRLNLVAGLRFDQHSEFGGNVAPRVALVWHALDRLRFRAAYGQSFTAPTLAQLYVTELRQRGRVIVEPNPDLSPERSQGFEIGAEGEYRGYRLAVTGFYNDMDDRIGEVFVRSEPRSGGRGSGSGSGADGGSGGGGGGPGAGPGAGNGSRSGGGSGRGTIDYFRLDNIERVRTYGVEMDFGLRLPLGMRLAGHATYMESEQGDANQPLAYEPNWKGFLKLAWQSPKQKLGGNLRLNYLGETEDGAGETINDYTTLSLYADYSLFEQTDLYAGIDNLAQAENEAFPRAPRTYYVGVRAHLW